MSWLKSNFKSSILIHTFVTYKQRISQLINTTIYITRESIIHLYMIHVDVNKYEIGHADGVHC